MEITKITLGGTVTIKIMPKAYEPIEASNTFLVEYEGGKSVEDVEKIEDRLNKRLEDGLRKKLEISLNVYKEFRKKIESCVV